MLLLREAFYIYRSFTDVEIYRRIIKTFLQALEI